MGCIFSIKTVKSLLTLISGTCQWSNFSYKNYMIYRYFLNLYRFTDKNLILKFDFNGYFRVFLSKMGTLNLSHFDQHEKTSREVEKIIILGEKKKSSKSVSVKQYSITNKTSNQVCVYDQCNGNYPCRVHSLC